MAFISPTQMKLYADMSVWDLFDLIDELKERIDELKDKLSEYE